MKKKKRIAKEEARLSLELKQQELREEQKLARERSHDLKNLLDKNKPFYDVNKLKKERIF